MDKKMKKIIITENENNGISILKALKALYMDGSEINSLEDIGYFMNKYREQGEIEIKVSENCLEIFDGYFKDDEITYKVK